MFDCAAVDAEALPRTRAEAVAVGAKRYFPGQPCAKGHFAPRYVSGPCVECMRLHNRAYEAANRDKRKARLSARYAAAQEQWRKYHREWKAANAEGCRESAKQARRRLVQTDAALAWARAALASARQRAKKRGVPFKINVEYLRALVVPVCPALGVELVYSATTGGGPIRHSASVDCIRPDLGYVPGNVMIVSHKANSIKSDATLQELRAVAAWVERVLAA